MNTDYLTRMLTFTEDDLPDLSDVVMGSLTYLGGLSLPEFPKVAYSRPLVVGSGNAYSTGQILFKEYDATYVEESGMERELERGVYDAVYVISASGGKHAVSCVETTREKNYDTYLITSNPEAKAALFLDDDHVFLYPHIREPYTYNTSTYLAMIFAKERTSPLRIRTFIEEHVVPILPSFGLYRSFLFTILPEFKEVRRMFETKFHELFGPHLVGHAFTTEEVKHAKTVTTSDDQCFISFGEENRLGNPGFRLTLPLPPDISTGEVIALGYFVIGEIQKAHRPYFKENIHVYVKEAKSLFGDGISGIVE